MAARPTALLDLWHSRVALQLQSKSEAVFVLGKDYGTSDLPFIKNTLPSLLAGEYGWMTSLSLDEREVTVAPRPLTS